MLGLLTLLLVIVAVFSLGWRLEQDAPLMLYFAWLTSSEGLVLYRDVFEHQPLGAHLAYRGVAGIVGYSDFGARCFDLAWLASILAVDFALLAPYGRRVAWAGSVLFGLAYLAHGPVDGLQRDFLMILPVAGAVLLEARRVPSRAALRAGLVGLLVGLAFTVKPQVGLLLLGFAVFEARAPGVRAGERLGALAALGAGFAVAPLAVLLELWRSGTLAPFADVVRNYWPLFASLDVQHRSLEDAQRLPYLWAHLRQLGGHGAWVAAAVLGLFLAVFAPPFASRVGAHERRVVGLLGGLALLSLGTTAAAGRFWTYHWFVFLHFVVLLASLCLLAPVPPVARGARAFPGLVLLGAALLGLYPAPGLRAALAGRPATGSARVDRIGAFLSENLRPGDTVQSLDWTGGAVNAMLRARAPTGTPFVTDFYFYHHVADPWIQQLRRRFVRELAAAKPRFVIDVWGAAKPWPRGAGTSRRFPELTDLLERHYRVVERGVDFRILERREPRVGGGAPRGGGAASPGSSR